WGHAHCLTWASRLRRPVLYPDELRSQTADSLARPRLLRHLRVRRLHELDERSQLARRVGAIRIVEVKRLVRRQVLVEDRNDGARGDLGARELSKDEAEPAALTGGAEHRAHLVEDESAAHVDDHVLAADAKFPLEEPRAVQTMTDAVVLE